MTDPSPADLQAIRQRHKMGNDERADRDIADLLAHIDKQDAEIERLRKEVDRLVPIAAVHGL